MKKTQPEKKIQPKSLSNKGASKGLKTQKVTVKKQTPKVVINGKTKVKDLKSKDQRTDQKNVVLNQKSKQIKKPQKIVKLQASVKNEEKQLSQKKLNKTQNVGTKQNNIIKKDANLIQKNGSQVNGESEILAKDKLKAQNKNEKTPKANNKVQQVQTKQLKAPIAKQTQNLKKPANKRFKTDDQSDEEILKPLGTKRTARQAAIDQKKDAKEKDEDIEMQDLSEDEGIPKKKAKPLKKGIPQNAKPSMPKVSAKKQKDIPPEYLQFVTSPEDFDPEHIDEAYKLSQEKHLLNTECCVHCTNRNVLRAVMTKNHDLLRLCINSYKQISTLLLTWAPESRWTPIEWVFYNDDMESFDILMEYEKSKKKHPRVIPDSLLLKQFDTGSVSEATYGVQINRVLTARGNRAGNEAFLQESVVEESTFYNYLKNQYFIARLMRMPNLTFDHIQKIMKLDKQMEDFVIKNLTQKLLINGKVDIAEKIIKLFIKDPIFQVNELMHSVLVAQEIKDLPENFNKLSVNKRSHAFNGIISLHTASLNPNNDILKRLLNMIAGNANLKYETDDFQNQCIHYAAACEDIGPLELLIKETPLFISVRCNRTKNVLFIVQEDEDSIYYKDAHGNYPIHLAAKLGHNDCIRILCKYDKSHVDTVGGYNKLTPLMYAASYGNYETVVYLVKTMRANVNLLDKFQRNALTYAIRNGHAKIAAFLLQNMAFYNYPDNSNNCALHFACAYGWIDCAKLLLKAGADVNCQNEWGYSPLLVAMLKNHKQIVKEILDIQGVDINGTDDSGRNLLSYSIQIITVDNLNYVKFLIEQKGANPNQLDIYGRTALFYAFEINLPILSEKFTINDIKTDSLQQRIKKYQEIHYSLVEYLIKNQNCQIDHLDKEGGSLLNIVIQYSNFYLLPLFRGLIDFNKTPELLFNLDPMLLVEDKSFFKNLLLSSRIKVEYLNGVDRHGETFLIKILKKYISQRSKVSTINHYLQLLRKEYLCSYHEKYENFENAIPKEQFYEDILKRLNEIQFNIKYAAQYSINQFNQIISQFNQGKLQLAQTYMSKKDAHNKTEQDYIQSASMQIFRELFTEKFIELIKILIDMGADVNSYSFNVQFLADEINIPEAKNLVSKDIVPGVKRDLIIPISKEENQKIAEKVQNSQEIFRSLVNEQSINSQINRYQNQTKLSQCIFNGLTTVISQCVSPYLLNALIQNGLDVNQRNQSNETLLIKLVRELGSDLEQFKSMYIELKNAKNLDINVTDSNGDNAFLLSFKSNYLKTANYLLDEGFDANFKNKESKTALIIAVERRDFDSIEMLLEKGVDPNVQDIKGRTALHYAINNSSSALEANYDIENILISSRANVNIQDRSGRTPLHYAFVKIGRGNLDKSVMDPIETVSSLCSVRDADPKIQDKYGKNVLHYAAQRGATISTMYLEKKGVDLHQKDIFGNTPLATALLCNHTQYAIMLIKEGSDVNQLVHPESKQVYEEFKKKRAEERMIIDKDDGYKSDESYFNGQQQANNNYGSYNIFGNPNPSIFQNHNLYQQQQLIKEPQTMFKLAVESGQLGLSYLILDNGFDLMVAMEDSLRKLKFQFVLTLLQKVSENSVIQKRNSKGQNLFHIFAQNAQTLNQEAQSKILSRIYKQFIRRELDVEQADNYGRTPLHYAAITGSYALVKLFTLEKGMQLNAKDINGNTPLISALKGKRIQIKDNFESFKLIANALNSCDQLYEDPLYKNEMCSAIDQNKDIIDTSIPVYKVTPFIHLIRQYNEIDKNLRIEMLKFFFGEQGRQDLYVTDINGKNALMLLIEQNQKFNIQEVFQTWENIHQKNPEKLIIRDLVDQQGRNVIHYLVNNSQIGMYDNIQLFDYLTEKGFSISVEDNNGMRPIDYASDYKISTIYKRLIKLGQVPKQSKSKQKNYLMEDVDMIITESEIDFDKDAEEFLSINQEKLKVKKEKKKILPDPILGDYVNNLEVMLEDPLDELTAYQAYLIKIDMKRYGYNTYVFYKLQLNHDKVKNIYILLTRWGMIGEQGMCQKTPFNKLEEALAEFKKVFKAKTSNEWDKRDDFQIPKAKNKYIYYKSKESDYSFVDLMKPFKFSECQRSILSQDAQNFMKLISNVAVYNEVLKLSNIQNSQINMTNIPRDKLEEALKILQDIEDIYNIKYPYDVQDQEEHNLKEVVMLSCKFFQLIPLMNQGQENIKPVGKNDIADYRNKIYDLITLEKASRIFLGATFRKDEISPLDYIYRALKINVELAPQESDDYKLIHQYLKNTGQSVLNTQLINNLYKIRRDYDDQKFKQFGFDNDPHRFLLFHGTSLQNIIGILNCGFKVSPLGVAQCGAAFGSGVYFSNFIEKSITYARSTNFNQLHLEQEELNIITDESFLQNRRYILVCEVAMGKVVKYEQSRSTSNNGGYSMFGGAYHQNTNHFAIGTQKQLKEILEDLRKAKDDIVQPEEPMDSDYEDDDESESEYSDKEENEEQVLKDDANNKQEAEVVFKDQINELPNGKVILGKDADVTRTLRESKMLQLASSGYQRISRFDTFWVGGSQVPDPQFNVLLRDGSIVPNGKPVQVVERTQKNKKYQGSNALQQIYDNQQSSLQFLGQSFSEFVVKNPDRIRIRYIVELRDMTETEKKNQVMSQQLNIYAEDD